MFALVLTSCVLAVNKLLCSERPVAHWKEQQAILAFNTADQPRHVLYAWSQTAPVPM